MLTSDGDVCVDCVPVIENVGDAKARLRRLGSSLPLLAIGIFFGWKDVASVRAGVFTRGGWRHDILRVDEPIWFWVNVSVTAVVALVCVAGAVGIVVSAITNRGSVEASVSARS